MNERAVIRLGFIDMLPHLFRHRFIDDLVNQGPRILRINHLVAIAVNNLALIVHDIVEIESPLSLQIIALLHSLLRRLD